jgi:hypothetical protein
MVYSTATHLILIPGKRSYGPWIWYLPCLLLLTAMVNSFSAIFTTYLQFSIYTYLKPWCKCNGGKQHFGTPMVPKLFLHIFPTWQASSHNSVPTPPAWRLPSGRKLWLRHPILWCLFQKKLVGLSSSIWFDCIAHLLHGPNQTVCGSDPILITNPRAS